MLKELEILECCRGETFVEYIYGELSHAGRERFENHLLDCVACTDEFAAIAESRYSVYEWQKLEFQPMITPTFVLPNAKLSASWFDTIKSTFATQPMLTTAGAFGLLLAIFGVTFVLFPSAQKSVDLPEVVDAIAVPIETESHEQSNTVATPSRQPGKINKVEFAAKHQLKKNQKQASNRKNNNMRLESINLEIQAAAPRLNDFEEFSDDSLRLADIVPSSDSRK